MTKYIYTFPLWPDELQYSAFSSNGFRELDRHKGLINVITRLRMGGGNIS